METPEVLGRSGGSEMMPIIVLFRDGSRRELDVTAQEAAELAKRGRVPPDGSELSGRQFDPSGKEDLIVTFQNGAKRRLVVTAEEARNLEGKGKPITSRIKRFYYSVPKPIRIALITLLVTALLTPAISRQFADRQLEADFKNTLAAQLSESSLRVIQVMHNLVHGHVPEKFIADADCALVHTKKYGTPKHQEKCDESSKESARAHRQLLVETLDRWTMDYRAIRGKLGVISDDKVLKEWEAFYVAVFHFGHLNWEICGDERSKRVAYVRDYFREDENDQVWKDLMNDKPCSEENERFFRAYVEIEDSLVHRSNIIAYSFADADICRYSVGLRDFFYDFNPFRRCDELRAYT